MVNPGSHWDLLKGDAQCWTGGSGTLWVTLPHKGPQGHQGMLWVSLGTQSGQRAPGSEGYWVLCALAPIGGCG